MYTSGVMVFWRRLRLFPWGCCYFDDVVGCCLGVLIFWRCVHILTTSSVISLGCWYFDDVVGFCLVVLLFWRRRRLLPWVFWYFVDVVGCFLWGVVILTTSSVVALGVLIFWRFSSVVSLGVLIFWRRRPLFPWGVDILPTSTRRRLLPMGVFWQRRRLFSWRDFYNVIDCFWRRRLLGNFYIRVSGSQILIILSSTNGFTVSFIFSIFTFGCASSKTQYFPTPLWTQERAFTSYIVIN